MAQQNALGGACRTGRVHEQGRVRRRWRNRRHGMPFPLPPWRTLVTDDDGDRTANPARRLSNRLLRFGRHNDKRSVRMLQHVPHSLQRRMRIDGTDNPAAVQDTQQRLDGHEAVRQHDRDVGSGSGTPVHKKSSHRATGREQTQGVDGDAAAIVDNIRTVWPTARALVDERAHADLRTTVVIGHGARSTRPEAGPHGARAARSGSRPA